MLLDLISDIFAFAQALIVDIPLQNGLSYLYVILNTVISLALTLVTGDAGGNGGSILPF